MLILVSTAYIALKKLLSLFTLKIKNSKVAFFWALVCSLYFNLRLSLFGTIRDQLDHHSLLAYVVNSDDLLEVLSGVYNDEFDGLHLNKSALLIVYLGLHSLDDLHLTVSCNNHEHFCCGLLIFKLKIYNST